MPLVEIAMDPVLLIDIFPDTAIALRVTVFEEIIFKVPPAFTVISAVVKIEAPPL